MLAWWGVLRKLVRIGRTQRRINLHRPTSSRRRYRQVTLMGRAGHAHRAHRNDTPTSRSSSSRSQLSLRRLPPKAAPRTRSTRPPSWVAVGPSDCLHHHPSAPRQVDVNERHHGVVAADRRGKKSEGPGVKGFDQNPHRPGGALPSAGRIFAWCVFVAAWTGDDITDSINEPDCGVGTASRTAG